MGIKAHRDSTPLGTLTITKRETLAVDHDHHSPKSIGQMIDEYLETRQDDGRVTELTFKFNEED